MKDHRIKTIVKGILDYLTEQKSLDLLPEIATELTKQSWVRFDPNLATIYASVKPTKTQFDKIKKILSQKYKNQKIRLKFQKDASIIAGFKINIDGEEIDGTVNKKLSKLKEQVIYDQN